MRYKISVVFILVYAVSLFITSCDTSGDPEVPNHKTTFLPSVTPNQILFAGNSYSVSTNCGNDTALNNYFHFTSFKNNDTIHVILGDITPPTLSKSYDLVFPASGFSIGANQAVIFANFSGSTWTSNANSGSLKLSFDNSYKIVLTLNNNTLQILADTITQTISGTLNCQ